ncbi:hypothetical protein C8R43DRAFT_877610 [Mycena crocata]|nr:hypothetical protein C8R43DRAFT_877610 [Mycena crocata]
MHNAHRIGKYWENIPECQDRAICHHCDVVETFEHIVLECTRPGQSKIWALAEEFWGEKHPDWPPLSLGSILGCVLPAFEDEKKRPQPSTARLYRILITESLWLVWKLRCECVIQNDGKPPTVQEIHNRWVRMMNERLQIDINLTNTLKFDKQYSLPHSLVLDTWRGTLKDEASLPKNWLSESEVLVGMMPMGSVRPPTQPAGVG